MAACKGYFYFGVFLLFLINHRQNTVSTTAQHDRNGVVIRWTVLRGVLGIVQMTGAIVSTLLLIRIGAARETIVAVSVTMVITLISITLFRWLKVQEKRR